MLYREKHSSRQKRRLIDGDPVLWNVNGVTRRSSSGEPTTATKSMGTSRL